MFGTSNYLTFSSSFMIFRRVNKIAKSLAMSVCRSVWLHVTSRIPLNAYLRSFTFEDFLKIFRENAS